MSSCGDNPHDVTASVVQRGDGFIKVSSSSSYPGEEPITWTPKIRGSLAAWRAANPNATMVNLDSITTLRDEDCACLWGIRAVRLSGCTGLTDEALRLLVTPPAGSSGEAAICQLSVLDISGCPQKGFTDAGILTLARRAPLTVLYMSGCTQPGITDEGLKALVGSKEAWGPSLLHTLQVSH